MPATDEPDCLRNIRARLNDESRELQGRASDFERVVESLGENVWIVAELAECTVRRKEIEESLRRLDLLRQMPRIWPTLHAATGDRFEAAAEHFIASYLDWQPAPKSSRLTQSEIRNAARKAARHAKALSNLVRRNYHLQDIKLIDLLPDCKQEELLTLFQRVVPHYGTHFRVIFEEPLHKVLGNLAAEAENRETAKPVAYQPNRAGADIHDFIISMSWAMDNVSVSAPNAIAQLASAFLDQDVNPEAVSKAWQRERNIRL